MASRQTSPLLRLPVEMRLETYELYIASLYQYDFFDIASVSQLQNDEGGTRLQRKTYSFLFAHPIIFNEAIALVMETHPIVFYDLDGLTSFAKEQPSWAINWQSRGNIVLDFGKCDARQMQKAIACLGKLRGLQGLMILIPKAGWTNGIALPKRFCRYCTFRSLFSIEVEDQSVARREEQKRRMVEREDAELTQLEALETNDADDAPLLERMESAGVLMEMLRIEMSRLKRQVRATDELFNGLFKVTHARRLRWLNKRLRIHVRGIYYERMEGPCQCGRPKVQASELVS